MRWKTTKAPDMIGLSSRTKNVPSTLHTSQPELSGLHTYEGGVHCALRASKGVEAARAVAARAATARNFIVRTG